MRNINAYKVPAGTVITINKIITNTIKNGNKTIPNDSLDCTIRDTGEKIKISIRNYTKFKVDGIELFKGDGDIIELPEEFGIISSKDKIDKHFNKMYPFYAYALTDKYLRNEITYDELVDEGLKEDNELEPLQEYTIGPAPKRIYEETPGIDISTWRNFYRGLGRR